MVRKSPLLIAAALVLGTASVASAQSWKYDQTPDSTLSYGPQTSAPAATRTANPAQEAVSGGPYWEHDQTPDSTLSYGARPAR